MAHETGGNCDAVGASGEKGCTQWMPETWAGWSRQVLGYVAAITPVNERYVALHKLQHHINQGYSDAQIALIWNQGHAGACSAGTNSKGVSYNSCAYRDRIVALLR